MQLTIDIRDSAVDKIMYLLNNLKSDVKIVNKINTDSLDINPIFKEDEDHKHILSGREERKNNPQNYGSLTDVNWE